MRPSIPPPSRILGIVVFRSQRAFISRRACGGTGEPHLSKSAASLGNDNGVDRIPVTEKPNPDQISVNSYAVNHAFSQPVNATRGTYLFEFQRGEKR